MNETPAEIVWEGELKTGLIGKVPGDPLCQWWIERTLRGPLGLNHLYTLRYWSSAGMMWDFISEHEREEECTASALTMARREY